MKVEPLASYLPIPILSFLVENASRGVLPPAFSRAAVIFVNLMGLSETIDEVDEGTVSDVVERFSGVFALINAAVEARGGVLKHVTYHLSGADMLIYFGLPNAHADDPTRAADAAHAIREIVAETPSPYDPDRRLSTKIGINFGEIFAAEVGETRGRREWNILGRHRQHRRPADGHCRAQPNPDDRIGLSRNMAGL